MRIKFLSAKEKIEQFKYYIFTQLREKIRSQIVQMQKTARALANIDVLVSLAEVAFKYNYVCRN